MTTTKSERTLDVIFYFYYPFCFSDLTFTENDDGAVLIYTKILRRFLRSDQHIEGTTFWKWTKGDENLYSEVRIWNGSSRTYTTEPD